MQWISFSYSELKHIDDALRLNPSNYAEILSLLIYIEDFTAQKEMYKYDLFVKNIYEAIHSVGGNIFKYKVCVWVCTQCNYTESETYNCLITQFLKMFTQRNVDKYFIRLGFSYVWKLGDWQ